MLNHLFHPIIIRFYLIVAYFLIKAIKYSIIKINSFHIIFQFIFLIFNNYL